MNEELRHVRDVITPEERRMIDEYIARNGVTRCAYGQTSVPYEVPERSRTIGLWRGGMTHSVNSRSAVARAVLRG